jgi:hypothetical protein
MDTPIYLIPPIIELNPLHLLENSRCEQPPLDEDTLTDPHESPTTSAFHKRGIRLVAVDHPNQQGATNVWRATTALRQTPVILWPWRRFTALRWIPLFHNVAVAVPGPEGNHFANAYVVVDDDIANRFASVLRCELTSPLHGDREFRGTSARRDDPDTKCPILTIRHSLPDVVGASHARISGEAFRAAPHRLGGNGERQLRMKCCATASNKVRSLRNVTNFQRPMNAPCGRLGNVSVSERPICVIGFCVGCWSRTMGA